MGGFAGGFVAGIVGYTIDIMTGAIFETFKPFNPLIPVYGVVFVIVSFLAGIMDAYYAGFFFSLGIVSAGFLLKDFVTTISGFISLAGVVTSLFMKSHGQGHDGL